MKAGTSRRSSAHAAAAAVSMRPAQPLVLLTVRTGPQGTAWALMSGTGPRVTLATLAGGLGKTGSHVTVL
jgi:hypothetical protein